MSQASPPSSARAFAEAAPESGAAAWGADFLRLLERNVEVGPGRRMVCVPDSNTAYALQQLCVSPDQRAQRCLTARYVVSGRPALGTMLAAFVHDMETLRARERETLGDLVDGTQGAHWADFAARLGSQSAWRDIVDTRLPKALDVGRFEPDIPGQVLETISPLGPDERLVLILDGEADYATRDLPQVANLPSGVLLVVTHPPERDLDWLTELIGPLLLVPPYDGTPPPRDRVTYADSALASDQPTDHDALGMTGLALTTAKLLMHEGTGPICIGIEAPWGKGKSSFLRLVRKQSERQTETNPAAFELVPIDFNAWVYNNAEQAWAGLAVEVIAAVEDRLSRWQRTALRWGYAWHNRRGLLVGTLTAAVLAVALSVLVAWLADWKIVSGQTGNPVALPLSVVSPTLVGVILLLGASYRLTRPVSQRVHEYLTRPDHAVRRGYQNDVVSDLRFTLASLHRSQPNVRVVVMVDDLDRCAEDKVVEILQAINVVLAQSDVYTLLAIDGDMVRRAVFRHYRDASEEKLPEGYQLDERFPFEYLEKIVQFSIRLPPTSLATRSAYVRSLFTLPPLGEPSTSVRPSAQPSVDEVIQHGLAIDLTQVQPVSLGDFTDLPMADTPAEADAMATYQRLLDDNPREIKRAINVHRFVKIALYRKESTPSVDVQRRLVLWVVLCLKSPNEVSNLLHQEDLESTAEDLLAREPSPFRGLGSADDQLPLTDLPLLVAAANLIQLVGAPGRS